MEKMERILEIFRGLLYKERSTMWTFWFDRDPGPGRVRLIIERVNVDHHLDDDPVITTEELILRLIQGSPKYNFPRLGEGQISWRLDGREVIEDL